VRFFCACAHHIDAQQPWRHERCVGTSGVLTEHKGEQMTEEGTLSIVRHGSPYQVRYASNNPQGRERPPYECPDAETLSALLHQCGAEAGAITQAYAELGQGRMAVLLVALSPEQMQAFFNPTTSRAW
jgi:hypothetical protein